MLCLSFGFFAAGEACASVTIEITHNYRIQAYSGELRITEFRIGQRWFERQTVFAVEKHHSTCCVPFTALLCASFAAITIVGIGSAIMVLREKS
jgi:hypothetical protein